MFTGVLFLIRYRDDPASGTWLMPLALLLCGFLPAGFSLVNASESFVGEKERNTLEALLSTPMSDRDLYLGKLAAASLPPVGSSLLAMITFTLLFLWSAPDFLAGSLWLSLVLILGCLVSLKVLVLVAATVIISVHATTVRAANLLASFVLIPMALLVQFEALLLAQDQAALLYMVMAGLLIAALMLIRAGLATFNRESLLAREHSSHQPHQLRWTFGRFLAGYHAPGVDPALYPRSFSVRRFYAEDLPSIVREHRLPLLIMTVALALGLAGGVVGWFDRQPGRVSATLASTRVDAAMWNLSLNLRLTFLSSVLPPLSLGLFAFLAPGVVATRVGYAGAGLLAAGDGAIAFLPYLLAHGLFTLPAMALGGAVALRMGVALLQRPPGFSTGQNMLWSAANYLKVLFLVLLPAFILAAGVEAVLRLIVARL
jgi:uncharacterized membrane protein SpoIIM required for sporulation